jgi:uncharacterized protein YijF (DUF1287 family)
MAPVFCRPGKRNNGSFSSIKRFICLHLFVLLLCASVDGQDQFAARLSDAAIVLTQSGSYDPSIMSSTINGMFHLTGVCTDVVVRAYRIAQIDLQKSP